MAELGNLFMPNILSPFNVSDIVENLVELRKKILSQQVQERKSLLEERSDAISRLRTMALDFLSASQAIAANLSYKVFAPKLTNITGSEDPKNILSASTSSEAVQGNFDVQVLQMARSWKTGSSTFANADVTLASLGVTPSSKIVIKGTDTSNAKVLEVDPNWTLKQLRDKINELNVGLTAYLQNVPGGVQLVISSSKTGASREYMTLVDSAGNTFAALGFFAAGPDTIKNQSGSSALSDAFTKKDQKVGELLGFAPGNAPSGTVLVDGNPVSIDLNTMTLEDIANAINSVSPGTAQVIQEDSVFRLKINSTNLDDNGTTVLKTLGLLSRDFQNVIASGQNAQISIDGNIFSSPDNTFTPEETGISGITFTALRASTDIIRVSISRDIDRIMKYFNDFVEGWNKIIDFINEQVKFNEKTGKAGPLSGDFSISATRSAMRRAFSGFLEVGQADGSVKLISIQDLGFSIDRDGKLSLNSLKLSQALQTDFETTVRALTSAVSEKVISNSFSSDTTSLGFSGEILVEGKSVVVNPSDTLRDIALKINSASDSVRAYVKTVSGNKKLVVEKLSGGLPSIAEVSGNLLVALGLGNSTQFNIKNIVNTNTVRTGMFYSDTAPVRNAIDSDTSTPDTSNNLSGILQIPLANGSTINVSVDISTDSLNDIANNINTAAGSNIASVKQEGNRYYIEISGVKTDPADWGSDPNLLEQFLGILKRQENKESAKLGFGEHTRREIGDLLSSKGAIGASKERIETELTGIDQKLAKIEEEVESYRALLYARWARANQIMSYTRSIMAFFQAISQQLVQGAQNPFLSGKK